LMGTGFALSGEIEFWIRIREFAARSKYWDGTPSMIFGSFWGTSDGKLGCLHKESWQRQSMFNLIKSVWSS
jgi:hypothetical protein